MSMRSYPSQRSASNMSGLEGFYDPSFPPHAVPPWAHNATLSGQLADPIINSKRLRKDNSAQQVMMALRDDQFGQIMEAISPSKKDRGVPHGLPTQRQEACQPSAQSRCPPKMGALSVPVRPSSAVMARTTAFTDLKTSSRNGSQRPSSGHAPPKSKNENHGSRVHTPIPFMLAPQRWDSDVSMRDGSSNFSSLSAHAPSATNHVKSRKEGLANDTDDSLDLDVRHYQSLLPTVNVNPTAKAKAVTDDPDQTPRNIPNEKIPRAPDHVEVIDVDAIDPTLTEDLAKLSPFKPSHKAAMSSTSSTGRLERQLYSALGEELGSFEQELNANGMGSELAQALSGTGTHSDLSGSTMLDPTVGEFEPTIKRKRQGTLGGERDKSPVKKKERARQAMVEDEDVPDDMPRLRGD